MENKEKLVMWIMALISIKESPLFPYDYMTTLRKRGLIR